MAAMTPLFDIDLAARVAETADLGDGLLGKIQNQLLDPVIVQNTAANTLGLACSVEAPSAAEALEVAVSALRSGLNDLGVPDVEIVELHVVPAKEAPPEP